MKLSIEQTYTSVGCNRIPEIVDWNSEGLVCFGASHAVVIFNTNENEKDPHTVCHHHTSRVNSVKWLHKVNESCTEFISCSADKTAAIWTLSNDVWKVTSKLVGHTNGITCIHGLYTEKDSLIVFTGSIDSTVKVWDRTNGSINLKQTISLNSGLCLTLHVHLLPVIKKPVLFCALDDHKIHVFAGDEEYHRIHTIVGHEDWVRGMDVLDINDSSIMLASASQDTYIRLWGIQQHVQAQPTPEIKVEEKVFQAYEHSWSVKLEAVLAGHEGWVYGVQWHPYVIDQDTNKKHPVYRLLSSSLDKTLIVWEPEAGGDRGEGGAWVERVRVGEVGGNGLGFYGSRFGPNGTSFLGHGYNGSFHLWTMSQETGQWQPSVVFGGHFGSIEDARWEPQGRYLVSVSSDQTTRLHAPWTRPGHKPEWHEIARPQVHGYDLSSLAIVDATTFVSAAEEKVIRVFRAPHNFLQNYRNIVGEALVDEANANIAEGASVPSLGLSNKAVFSEGADGDDDGYFVPVNLNEPPSEESLMQNTLWPECHKLYGHGYEVHALASTAHILASACRATTAQHAAILLWDTKNWQQIQELVSHQLTVTQMEFSPDGQRLVSVSRDRRWTLYQRRQGSNLFDIAATTDKSNGVHTRIIWCCAWALDSTMFGTGSRDGKVCLWFKSNNNTDSSLRGYGLAGPPLELATSVTALSFAPVDSDTKIIAIGFETGIIRIYAFNETWSLLREMDNSAAHHLTVSRLAFRPRRPEDTRLELASCSADHFLRIHAITVTL